MLNIYVRLGRGPSSNCVPIITPVEGSKSVSSRSLSPFEQKRQPRTRRLVRKRVSASCALAVVVTTTALVLSASAVQAATREFGPWTCTAPRLVSLESVAASPPPDGFVFHHIAANGSNRRVWNQPGAATYRYRLYQVGRHSASFAEVSAHDIDAAAPVCTV